MAEYMDKEKVLSTLENTAKYYEMPNADEWTKGIHYGLIHGVDNIVDNVPIEDVVEREKVKQAREEIDDLDRYFDNDYFSSNSDAMFKCSDVFAILDKLIAESEG